MRDLCRLRFFLLSYHVVNSNYSCRFKISVKTCKHEIELWKGDKMLKTFFCSYYKAFCFAEINLFIPAVSLHDFSSPWQSLKAFRSFLCSRITLLFLSAFCVFLTLFVCFLSLSFVAAVFLVMAFSVFWNYVIRVGKEDKVPKVH